MKKKKLNTLNIFGDSINSDVALSRNEMKKIMAGSSQCNCLYCELSNGGVNTYATNCSSNYPSAYCAWFTGDIFASGSYGIC